MLGLQVCTTMPGYGEWFIFLGRVLLRVGNRKGEKQRQK
jgi:hypothetical protein